MIDTARDLEKARIARDVARMPDTDATQYVPARDLRAGDVMWDASGPYRISNVRRANGQVTFDVDAAGFQERGWALAEDEQVRIYV